jgi:hypothetical protein
VVKAVYLLIKKATVTFKISKIADIYLKIALQWLARLDFK